MYKIIYVFMVGDLFHAGHLRLLQRAKKLGDRLVVGVLTGKAAVSYKREPIIPLRQRMDIIKALECVDEVIEQDEKNPLSSFRKVDADILVHGDNWLSIPGTEEIEKSGKLVVKLPYTKNISTTKIIKKIKETK